MSNKAAAGAGSIRKKTIIKNGKDYTYWEGRYSLGRDPGTGKQIQKTTKSTQLSSLCYTVGPCLSILYTAVAKSLQSCPTLCDPIDGSPPGSPILGILQARTLEWVAISFSNA